MTKNLYLIFIISIIIYGCSSPEPSERFLNSKIRIITGIEEDVKTELLRMRPKDLYNAFDRNIRKKKWKKEHENSWMLIIKGNDPSTKIKSTIVFTLSLVPQFENDVIVKNLSINGVEYDSIRIIEMMHQLDASFPKLK